MKYYKTYSLITLIFYKHVTCNGASYPMIQNHAPRRHNRIVVFNNCVLYSHTMQEVRLVETQLLP